MYQAKEKSVKIRVIQIHFANFLYQYGMGTPIGAEKATSLDAYLKELGKQILEAACINNTPHTKAWISGSNSSAGQSELNKRLPPAETG